MWWNLMKRTNNQNLNKDNKNLNQDLNKMEDFSKEILNWRFVCIIFLYIILNKMFRIFYKKTR